MTPAVGTQLTCASLRICAACVHAMLTSEMPQSQVSSAALTSPVRPTFSNIDMRRTCTSVVTAVLIVVAYTM